MDLHSSRSRLRSRSKATSVAWWRRLSASTTKRSSSQSRSTSRIRSAVRTGALIRGIGKPGRGDERQELRLEEAPHRRVPRRLRDRPPLLDDPPQAGAPRLFASGREHRLDRRRGPRPPRPPPARTSPATSSLPVGPREIHHRPRHARANDPVDADQFVPTRDTARRETLIPSICRPPLVAAGSGRRRAARPRRSRGEQAALRCEITAPGPQASAAARMRARGPRSRRPNGVDARETRGWRRPSRTQRVDRLVDKPARANCVRVTSPCCRAAIVATAVAIVARLEIRAMRG